MRAQDLIATWPRPAAKVRKPMLVVVAGLPASGKSYFTRAVSAQVPLAHLASDVIRMALTDGHPTYSSDESALVFGTLGRLVRTLLAEDYHVVVDATGIKPRDRAASLAHAGNRPTILVWCQADETVALERLARRAVGADPHDRSEATAEIRAMMSARVTPPTEREAGTLIILEPATFDAGVKSLVRRLT